MSKRDTEPKPEVSVVVPVFRNAATLPDLRRRVDRALDEAGITHEMILVVDACPEGSQRQAEEIASGDARVRVLALERNMGQNAAALEGIRLSSAPHVVLLDADLQDPPEAIPALLERAEEGYAAVFAGRRGRYESPGRLFTSGVFKWLLHKITNLPRDAGMFVLFDRRVREHLLLVRVRRPIVVAMIGTSGLPLTSIPVERDHRAEGRSAYSSWRRLATALAALWWALRWRLNPRGIMPMVR